MRNVVLTVAVVGIIICAVVVAVTRDSNDPKPNSPPTLGFTPNIVTDDELDRLPPGSAERMIYSWAQAIQFGDAEGVARMYRADRGPERESKAIKEAVLGIRSLLGRPEVTRIEALDDKRARVRGYLVSYNPERQPVLREPLTIYLTKFGDEWYLDDPTFLLESYQRVKAAASKQSK